MLIPSFFSGNPCGGEVFTALGKTWCVRCFSCSLCDKKLDQKWVFRITRLRKNTIYPGLNFTSSTWNPHASGKYRQHSQKYFQKFSCYERFPPELKKRISDNLKEREAETLKRRSASPAAPTTAGSGRNKSVSWSV